MTANAVYDIWTGDMGYLLYLFVMFLPFVLIYAAFMWIKGKITTHNNQKKETSNVRSDTYRPGN